MNSQQKKQHIISLIIAVLGGALSLVLAGCLNVFYGFITMGFVIGASVGFMKNSVKRGVVVGIFSAILGILVVVTAIFVGFISSGTDISKAVLIGIIIGTLMGAGVGAVTGYSSGEKIIIDSLETTIGGIIGGIAAMVIVALGYQSSSDIIRIISGAAGGAIFTGTIILALEIAERNSKSE